MSRYTASIVAFLVGVGLIATSFLLPAHGVNPYLVLYCTLVGMSSIVVGMMMAMKTSIRQRNYGMTRFKVEP